MKQINKFLFPIDLASNFETLIPWVQSFAAQFNATVYLLFVAPDVSPFVTHYLPNIGRMSRRMCPSWTVPGSRR
jgi:hypothetical protein